MRWMGRPESRFSSYRGNGEWQKDFANETPLQKTLRLLNTQYNPVRDIQNSTPPSPQDILRKQWEGKEK